ncbi:MAG: sugar ABC transporter permease [Myxococcota bacterium]|nr:sugar ABC transporter permease [Myxococcota bacterium]
MTARPHRSRNDTWAGQWWRHALLVPVTVLTLYPVLWVLKMALTPQESFELSASPLPDLSQVSLVNFEVLLGSSLFWRQMLNSLLVAAATTVVGILLSCTAAYSFSRFEFPGRKVGMTGLLVTQMFPGVLVAIPLYILMDMAGLLNSLTGLTLCYATTAIPFCVWMLKGYFDTIPRDLEEAALLDGASRWMIFTRIILPLSRPAIAVTALFSFMTAWNEFILAATFMNRASAYTVPVALQAYVGDRSTDWGLFAAGAVVVSLPVMALFFALQKQLVEGLTAGSVKG